MNISVTDRLLQIPDAFCDHVLCLGPLYHLKNASDRLLCMKECRRILKPDGIAFFAYINTLFSLYYYAKNRKFPSQDIVEAVESGEQTVPSGFDRFVAISHLTDPGAIESEAAHAGFMQERNLATDGASYLIQEQLEEMSDSQWKTFVQMHLRHCEDPASFGMSMHGLLICRVTEQRELGSYGAQ